MTRGLLLSLLILALSIGLSSSAGATTIASGSWGGAPIVNPDPGDDPFSPSGSYSFDYDPGSMQLELVLTSTSSEVANWNLLAGLLWDVEGSITLAPVSATAEALVNPVQPGNDVSGHWAFRSNISVVNFGSYGVGGAGDILFGEDTFGDKDCFIGDCLGNSPNGADYLIAGDTADFTQDGLPSSNPLIQNSATFLWDVTGDDKDTFSISNAQPIFGTDGAPIIPEPSSALLAGLALLAVRAGIRRTHRA